jgi:2'-5' RNA ligase
VPTAVVCAAFDPATDARIERLRAAVEDAGHRVRRAHRPHLTLVAARVDDPAPVADVAVAVAARHPALTLSMIGLDGFPSGVLFVRTEPSPALRALQRDAHDTITARWPSAFGRPSAPAGWVAHCTLATRLPRPALQRLQAMDFEPFAARVTALAVILVGGRGDVAEVPLPATTG